MLLERKIDDRLRRLPERRIFHRIHLSDNSDVPSLSEEVQMFSDRILAGPEALRRSLINYGDHCAVAVIAVGEVPPTQKADSCSREELWSGRNHRSQLAIAGVGDIDAIGESSSRQTTGKWRTIGDAGLRDHWQSVQTLYYVAIKLFSLG